jgi:hypothetical protein
LLPADFFEVDAEVLCFAEQSIAIDLQGMYAIAVVHEMDHVNKGANGKDFHPPDHGGFTGVQFGDDKAGDFSGSSFDGDGERAADGANASVEREFTDEKAIRNLLLIQSAIGTEDAESHRKIEAGAFFADVGGGEVNGYVSERDIVAAILESGANAVAALANRGIGEADGVEVILAGLDTRNVHLDFNDAGIDAIDGCTESFIEHAVFGMRENATICGRSQMGGDGCHRMK